MALLLRATSLHHNTIELLYLYFNYKNRIQTIDQ